MRDFCTSEKQVESCAAEINLLNLILEIVSFSSERFRDIIVSSSIFVLSGSKRVESIFTDRNKNLERKVRWPGVQDSACLLGAPPPAARRRPCATVNTAVHLTRVGIEGRSWLYIRSHSNQNR